MKRDKKIPGSWYDAAAGVRMRHEESKILRLPL